MKCSSAQLHSNISILKIIEVPGYRVSNKRRKGIKKSRRKEKKKKKREKREERPDGVIPEATGRGSKETNGRRYQLHYKSY